MCDEPIVDEPDKMKPALTCGTPAGWTCVGCEWLIFIVLKHEIPGTDTFIIEDVWLCRGEARGFEKEYDA